jgi:hypothetical protein
MKVFALILLILVAPSESAAGQKNPLQGTILLSVDEPVREGERPSIELTLATLEEYPCSNFSIATSQRRRADTVNVTIVGLVPEQLCDDAFGPAHARLPLRLSPARYTLTISRGNEIDRLQLDVTASSLIVRPRGRLAFIRPDTSVFLRPAARSFLVSCGTPNIQELCDDLATWLASQPGIVRRQLAANDSIGFPRYGGYWHTDYQLYEYANYEALEPVRRCMRYVADTLAESVGAGITLQTANGEVMWAWSRRALHEPHIPVARKVSGTRGCP